MGPNVDKPDDESRKPGEDCHQHANRLGRQSGARDGDWRDNPYTPGTRQWFEFSDGQDDAKKGN